jgi:hypothetical protein
MGTLAVVFVAIFCLLLGIIVGIHLPGLGKFENPQIPQDIKIPFTRSKQKLKPKSVSESEIVRREMSGPPLDPS